MQVLRVPTANGIDDIKLLGETESERLFIKQLAEAGTLSCMSRQIADTIVFRPISVMSDISSYSNSKNDIGKYDFIIRQNENHIVDLSFKKNDTPLNLNEFSGIKLQVKQIKSTSALIELSLGSGLEISGVGSNVLKVSFSSVQTNLLNCQEYYYDILMSKPTSNVYYLEGKITVKQSATR
jgi:hypothetical protein